MAGLVGVIAHDRRDVVTDAEIDALTSIYESLRGQGRRHTARVGMHTRLVLIDTVQGERPGIERRDESWAAVSGVIYPRGSLLDTDLDRIDGQFALVRYDECTDTVQVATDPLSMRAFYIAEREGKTYISTSAQTLAKHLKAAPNGLAIEMLLRCGLQYGPITNWEGIERLEPATCLIFTSSGRRRTAYWQLELDERIGRLCFDQAVDHAIEVLTDTYHRYFKDRPRTWVDLTGGFDTRAMALLLRRAGVDFRVNTCGTADSADVRLAHQVAGLAGWDWARFRVPENWAEVAPSWVSFALSWVDGRLPAPQLAEVLWMHQRKSFTHGRLLSGGGGDVYRGHAWRQEFFQAGRSTTVNYHNLITMNFTESCNTEILATKPTNRVYEYLYERMKERTKPYAGMLNTVQLDALLAYKRPNWDGIYSSAANAFLQVELPFFLKPAFSTGFSMPSAYRNRHRLMRAMVERLDARIAAIPTTSGGPAQLCRLQNMHRFAPYYTNIGRTAINKVSQRTWGRSLPDRRREVEDPRVVAGRNALLRELSLSPSNMLSASFFQPLPLARFLREAATPEFTQGDMLGRVITVELLLRGS